MRQLLMSFMPGWTESRNDGERCLCGEAFDRLTGECAQGHFKGETYFVEPDPAHMKMHPDAMQCLRVANQCSICHAPIGESDDICGNKHIVGKWYTQTMAVA